MMEYKGYAARIIYDAEDDVLVGEIVDIRDVVAFEGRSLEEMKNRMEAAVDGYLAYCEEEGIEPAKPYSGRFNIRMDSAQHRAIATAAAAVGRSMNDWVVEKLSEAVTTRPRSPRAGKVRKKAAPKPGPTTRSRKGKRS